MKKLTFIFILSFIFYGSEALTQDEGIRNLPPEQTPEWVDMMNDPSVNFYDVQQSFNTYFQNRDKGKGTGWKQFKRWEWFVEPRVFPSGDRIPPDQAWKEMDKFNKNHPQTDEGTRSEWEPMGPAEWTNNTGHWNPGLGRINVIARHPSDPNTIYIGAPSGGLWKTTDEGANWEVLTDDQPVMGVSAIAINPDDPNIVYIGTGDKDASDNYSIGVLKSTDGGYTWETTGLEWTIYQNRVISKLLIDPTNTNVLYASASNGLYKTTDAGDTWNNILGGDIDDIEFKPNDYNTIYAITRQFFRSTDGGNTFTQTSGLPTSSRAQIAVTDANPEYVYFFSSGSGIYRSDNSGVSFTKRSNQPNPGYQAWYDLAMDVSDVNPEEVHIGEINTWRSTNGAQSWTKTTDWTWGNSIGYTHCDIHEMVFYGGTLYVGSDGLISKSTDQGETWINLTDGVCIRQFYRIGTSKNDAYKILGGSQDNGTSVYTTDHWHEWLGADGMECVVDYSNSNIVYGTSQNGNFYKSNNGGNFGNVSITQPGGGAWVTPFVIHPTDPQTLFVGSTQVRKTTNGMNSWASVSNLPGGYIDGMAISATNPDYLYVSKDQNLYRTKDGGATWDNLSGSYPYLYITYIAISPTNPEKVAITFSGYNDGDKVYLSDDAGDTWDNISYNLPNIPANCIVFQDGPLEPVYVGMDVGVYYMDNALSEWEPFMEGLPNVIVNELEINEGIEKIRAGTYGRGLWESDLHLAAPSADFEADQTLIPIGCAINFISLSSGPPETYEWHFDGGSPDTSSLMNPSGIMYENTGSFTVTLIVVNSLGSDTMVKEAYINVSDTLLPNPNFEANETAICTNQTVLFMDLTEYCPNTWLWEFDPNTVTFVNGTNQNDQYPEVMFESGAYDVTLTTSNNVGSQSITKSEYILAGGLQIPFTEDFEIDGFDSKGWVVENPDDSKTWGMDSVLNKGDGHWASWINIFNYQSLNQRDRLISPILNFSGYADIYLSFDHAYAQRYSQKDSLIVYISDNCGATWSRVWGNGPDGSGVFATSEPNNGFFEPQSVEDWCGSGYGSECYMINLSDWAGMPNIQIAFESFSVYGNNLYLDNVLVDYNTRINSKVDKSDQFSIYPNPTHGEINVVNHSGMEIQSIAVLDLQGRQVGIYPINMKDQQIVLNISNLEQGIYFVQLTHKQGITLKKVVLQ